MRNKLPLAMIVAAIFFSSSQGWVATALLLTIAAMRWIWLRPMPPPPPTASALVESELAFEPIRRAPERFDPMRRHLRG